MKIDLSKLLKERRDEILAIAAKTGATNVRVFGSVARGQSGDESDIDFLVDMEKGRTLLDIGGLLTDLEDLLGCKVDIVTEKGLKQSLRAGVLSEARPV